MIFSVKSKQIYILKIKEDPSAPKEILDEIYSADELLMVMMVVKWTGKKIRT